MPNSGISLLDLTVGELLEAVAERSPAPGGGAVAAIVTALAAALAGMAARYGDGPPAQPADDLCRRAAPLADADAAAYGTFLAARRLPPDDPARSAALAQARDATTAVPAEIGEVAGAVAELAADLARDGNPNLRGDAAAAVLLAAAAAKITAGLVAENLGEAGDPRLDHARAVAAAAYQRATEIEA